MGVAYRAQLKEKEGAAARNRASGEVRWTLIAAGK